jgi:acylphosphatase
MRSAHAMKRVRVVVRGRVQGVGFRASTAYEARHLGVTGWVRNLPDGGVEAVVDGAPDAVDALLAWLAHGPPGARVTSVDIADVAPGAIDASQPLQGFHVRT